LLLEVVDRKNFAAKFYHLKVENPQNEGEARVKRVKRVQLGAHFGVVEKLISDFLIPVH